MALKSAPGQWSPAPVALNKRFIRLILALVLITSLVWLAKWHGLHAVSLQDNMKWPTKFAAMSKKKQGPVEKPISEYYDITAKSPFTPVRFKRPSRKTVTELCASFPRHVLKSIQPVLKMSHGEDRRRIGAQLDSVSACFGDEDLPIYSDLDEEVRGHRFEDVLEDMPEALRVDNPDFDNYVWQKEMQANGTLDDHDAAAGKKIDGRALDRFKFLPMIERVYAAKPNKEFYVFFETDTYIFWDNLFRFLKNFNPDDQLYMGSPTPGRATEDGVQTYFANAGPGFVLSRGAIQALVAPQSASTMKRRRQWRWQWWRWLFSYEEPPPLVEKWATLAKEDCCGDSVLGWALWDLGIPLMGLWPMFNPHSLHGIPYSDKYWCQPVLSLHGTKPDDMRRLWVWEFEKRSLNRPLLYSDLWEFHHPSEPAVLDNWDNGDWDGWVAPSSSVVSAEDCEQFCMGTETCVQWLWKGREKKCVAMRSIRYGEKAAADADVRSGWVVDRVRHFRHQRKCDEVQWVRPSTKRIY